MTNQTDPAKLTKDLGGKWYRSNGVAPCPVCQPERRKDQDALGIRVKGGTLLLNCKKNHCDFRDILMAAGIAPGAFEVDAVAAKATERMREEQARKPHTNRFRQLVAD